MRSVVPVLVAAACLLGLTGCKKRAEMSLPLMPGCRQQMSNGNLESPEATQVHVMLICADGFNGVKHYYATELSKLGFKQAGDVFTLGGDNMEHSGTPGRSGSVGVKDPTQPAAWVTVVDQGNSIMVDLWESVPTPK